MLSAPLLSAVAALCRVPVSAEPLALDTVALSQLPALLAELESLRGMALVLRGAVCADEAVRAMVEATDSDNKADLR
jgi:hypothetical protein